MKIDSNTFTKVETLTITSTYLKKCLKDLPAMNELQIDSTAFSKLQLSSITYDNHSLKWRNCIFEKQNCVIGDENGYNFHIIQEYDCQFIEYNKWSRLQVNYDCDVENHFELNNYSNLTEIVIDNNLMNDVYNFTLSSKK